MQRYLDTLFIVFQYLVPQHALSRLVGKFADSDWPWIRKPLIQWFVNRYGVDMSEAEEPNPLNYPCFNAFFTRALKPDARPIDDDKHAIVCPADGAISQLGDIQGGRIFQAKGQSYSLIELLGGDPEMARPFQHGKFATVYLSPRDYHRVHMPLAGKLTSMTYVPGDLFSVNGLTASRVPRLFARNERAVCIFETRHGPMAVVLVGAMIVAGIETVWAGQVAPIRRRINTHHYAGRRKPINLKKGEEMGRFKLGSTAIVLFGPDVMEWQQDFQADTPTRMGETMGRLIGDSANA